MNGFNVAWINYGWDFNTTADSGGMSSLCGMHDALQLLRANRGNTLRLWMFQGAHTDETKAPFSFDAATGLVNGIRPGVIERARLYLDMAASYGAVMILVLWNGAYVESADALTCRMLADEKQANAIIEHVVTPLAKALAGHPALAAWEVMNEPGGMVDFRRDVDASTSSSRCTNLEALFAKGREDGGGWTTCLQPVEVMQRMVNQQIAALKAAAPQHLVTGSSWSPSAISDSFGNNLWSDECLVSAGGQPTGTIDLYQPHDYAKILKSYGGKPYGAGWPGTTPAGAYALPGPVLVGEISNVYDSGEEWQAEGVAPYNESMATLATQIVANGYAGLLTWEYSCDPGKDGACIGPETIAEGVRAAATAHADARTLPARVLGHPETIPPPAKCGDAGFVRAASVAPRHAGGPPGY